MLLSHSTTNVGEGPKKLPALLLALSLALPQLLHAQIACDNDGVPVEFDLKKGVVELKDVKVKDITGNKDDDRAVLMANPGLQSANATFGSLMVNTLSATAFPDDGLSFSEIYRDERNVWKAEFPKGRYEFADKNDLVLEFEVTVLGGQASHISMGSASKVSLSVQDAGIDAKFHGGKQIFLKELEGDLDFRFFNLFQLAIAGIHRANISLCVNVRGYI